MNPNMMFDNRGQINANSVAEAMQVINKFASILQDNTPSNLGLAGQPSFSDDKRDELITRAIMTQEGKISLAQAMANPINF